MCLLRHTDRYKAMRTSFYLDDMFLRMDRNRAYVEALRRDTLALKNFFSTIDLEEDPKSFRPLLDR